MSTHSHGNWESLSVPWALWDDAVAFLEIIKDDGFSNSKSFSRGIGHEN